MNLLSSLSLKIKFLLISSIFILFFILIPVINIYNNTSLISGAILPAFGKEAMQAHKDTLKNIVEIEADFLAQAVKNAGSNQEIEKRVVDQTDPLRFFDDKSGYFFTYDLNGVRVNVPINKSDNGKNLIELKDKKGYPIVAEFIKAAKNGGGFVTYYFEKEGKGVQPKLSYVQLIPGTNILVGTGVYIDNVEENLQVFRDKINQELHSNEWTMGFISLAMMLVIGVALFLLATSIIRPVKALRDAAELIARGDFLHRAKVLSADEVGQTADSINHAFDKVADKIFWYESILDSIQFPLSVTDLDMNWTFVNKSALQITGAKREDILGKQCSNWGADICNTERCGLACLRRGIHESTFHQPGLDRDFKVNAYFLQDRNGQKIGHVEVVQDITEANDLRKAAEKALKDGVLRAAQQLESVVEIVTSASEQLSAQIEQSSRGAEGQAHRIGETSTSMEEMNATVLEVARNASSAASTADQAKVQAEEGAKVVSQVVHGIEEVQRQSQEMKQDMGNLGEQAEGIGQILNVISDIADQTNLLALNAAIEAARAGEAGRGFAVVADEVRKLAEKTMTATKEVGDAIRGIQNGTRKNIENVERSGKTIEDVTKLANTSGESLRHIVSLAETTTDQVRSIATASEEQSAASEEINRSLEDVNRVSLETTDAMVQSSQAVGELANQAQVLKRLVDEMKSDGESSSAALPSGKKPLALGGA